MNKYLTGACAAAFMVAPFVASQASAATWSEAATCEDSSGTTNCTLNDDVTESVTISSNTVLNLNGHNITSTTGDAIYVNNGVSLTINGNGTVESQKDNYASIFNNGTVTLNGGNYYHNDTDYSYYAILNHGTMTINDGVTVNNGLAHNSSLIANGYYNYSSTNERLGYVDGKGITSPTLTINGGTFDGGMNTVKNDDNGVLVINGGTFSNNYQVAVLNWNETTINGGTFNVPTGDDKTTVFVGSYGASSVDKGILTITDGTFNSEYTLELGTGTSSASVTITGGTFNSTVAFVNSAKKSWDELGTSSITGGSFTDETITPDDGYTKVAITINGEAGVLVTTATLDTTDVDVALNEGETSDTGLHEDIVNYGTWAVEDETVAKVENGIITALKAGTTKLTVTFGESIKTYNITVTEAETESSTSSTISSPDTGFAAAGEDAATTSFAPLCGVLAVLLSAGFMLSLSALKRQWRAYREQE